MQSYPVEPTAEDWASIFATVEDTATAQQASSHARRPCGNPQCDQLTDALFCHEACRVAVEGADDLQDGEGCLVATPAPVHAHHEAPVSVNTYITLAGHQVQLTLRGTDEREVLTRLETVLRRYPVGHPNGQGASAAPQPRPVCPWHGAMKESTKVAGSFFCPAKMADGTYCKERAPVKGASRPQ